MWYITSGVLQGVSGKERMAEGFIELYDAWVQSTGHHPDLGVLGAASKDSFSYSPENTFFFLPEWVLFEGKRIPRMSHDFESPQDHMASLFEEGLPDLDTALGIVRSPQDAILDENIIDAPNSREDVWEDVIEVPEDYWNNADEDASLLGS